MDFFLDKHTQTFVPYSAESEYQVEIRAKYKEKPLGIATINHPTQFKNH